MFAEKSAKILKNIITKTEIKKKKNKVMRKRSG